MIDVRLIDADALIHELNNSHYPGAPFVDAGISIAIGKVWETPTIEREPKWIPCSERLPEKEGWYITTVESEKTGKRRIENDLFAVDIALAHGHTPNKFSKDGYRQRTVAWMSFPEPWKGDCNDNQND